MLFIVCVEWNEVVLPLHVLKGRKIEKNVKELMRWTKEMGLRGRYNQCCLVTLIASKCELGQHFHLH